MTSVYDEPTLAVSELATPDINGQALATLALDLWAQLVLAGERRGVERDSFMSGFIMCAHVAAAAPEALIGAYRAWCAHKGYDAAALALMADETRRIVAATPLQAVAQ